MNEINTSGAMRIEQLPFYGSDIQQRIADVSEIIFNIQQERTIDEAVSMLKMAAERLEICSLAELNGSFGKISLARIIDKADSADREVQRISDDLLHSYIELCKENELLDTLKKMLEDNMRELHDARKTLETDLTVRGLNDRHYFTAAWQRVGDMRLSEAVAARSVNLIDDMTAGNSIFAERINSLRVNTLVLWRANISALKAVPSSENLKQACGTENVIAAAVASIVK